VLNQSDFNRFAALSEDDNPIHVDPAFSASTKFGKTVAHGMLLYSLICKGLSNMFPGHLQVSQEFIFPSPTFVGELLTISLEAISTDPKKDLVQVTSKILRPTGEVGCDSKTLLTSNPDPSIPEKYSQEPEFFETSAGNSHKSLSIGEQAAHQRIFMNSDINLYLELSEDRNFLYNDLDFVRKKGFQGLIVPAPLLAGMFSYLLGTELPGRGTNWLKMSLNYLAPTYLEQQITAQVCITRIRPEKDLVNLQLISTNQNGDTISQGEALVLVKDLIRT
jgi:acyl dehydratase